MRIPKRFIPGFPKCRFKWLEKKLQRLHRRLFRGYYDVVIPPFSEGNGSIYIWNGGPKMTADEIVSAQPMTAPCDLPWEIVYSDGSKEELRRLWSDFFRDIGQPGEEERLKKIDEFIEGMGG